MSVEFAQQTERARLAKRARETSSGIQTQSEELGWQDSGEQEEVDAASRPLGRPGELRGPGAGLPMAKVNPDTSRGNVGLQKRPAGSLMNIWATP